MYIEQLYTGCLSEAAYYIESEGEAAIIDPLRDIEEYLHLAKKRNATIRYIFETHFHADFVSGHLDLAKVTGAPIIYGPHTETSLPVYIAKEGESFQLGKVRIKVLHTPGHTLESTCYLLGDETGKNHALFTGDTLFVNDVGRPDLAQKENELSVQDLAGMLYDSLQQKIFPLEDSVIVYPAHGQGSSCGKNLGPNTFSTIGEQKKQNYALQPQDRETFIKAVTENLAAPPSYFPVNARINKQGYESLEEVLHKGLTPLDLSAFKERASTGAVLILDTRPAEIFINGFVPNSCWIGLEGRFAEWAGSLLPFDQPLLLVTEKGKEKETIIRLARVGFELFEGYLEGGFTTWQQAGEPIDLIIDVEADELAMDLPFDPNLIVLDVRKETEFGNGHVANATNLPLESLTDPGSLADFSETDNLYIHCGSGYRSVIACSLFKKQGFHNIRNIQGGWAAIEANGEIAKEKSSEILN